MLTNLNRRTLLGAHDVDDALLARLASADIAPTAALWGRGQPESDGWPLLTEQAIAAAHPEWCQLLERAGLEQERRVVSLRPAGLVWQWFGNDLNISFCLPRGCFATAVIRELAATDSETPDDEDPAE